MSVTIGEKKLKFEVYGNGFEESRNDSGNGQIPRILNLVAYSAIIDETNTYLWTIGDDTLRKFQLSDLTEVAQTTIPATVRFLIHPTNVANNYGIAFSNGTSAYVFDLTSGEVLYTTTGSFFQEYGFRSYDCVLVDNIIYYIRRYIGRTNLEKAWLNLNDMTYGITRIRSNIGCCGFFNGSNMYAVYQKEWFYQTECAYSLDINGNALWSNTGIDNNINMNAWGLVGNGKIYLPVYKNDRWHYGMFDGTSNPTFSPPKPIRTFGTFNVCPTMESSGHAKRMDVAYNDGHTKACVWTQAGLLYTDFHIIDQLDSVDAVPLAISDRYIVCMDKDTSTKKLYIYDIY